MESKKFVVLLIIILIAGLIILGLISISIKNNKKISSLNNKTLENVDSGNDKLDVISSDLADREIQDDPIISDEEMVRGYDS